MQYILHLYILNCDWVLFYTAESSTSRRSGAHETERLDANVMVFIAALQRRRRRLAVWKGKEWK